ncbi:hypothetical protein BDV93DRAFT_551486 [Ceratobasidium sp. AG-I]|nr:hypothetical protein BDV93DRAFT_551486 [Ceratobasidium sp. AG-I]
MQFLDYNITHPYPHNRLFSAITFALILLATPVLVLINIVVVGYELVPTLRPSFQPNDTFPSWWDSPRLPSLLRRGAPDCEPRDIGRGDTFRVLSSLFEYKVVSSWRTNSVPLVPEDEGRVEYTGGSFNVCSIYSMRFDYNLLDFTQTITVAIYCSELPVRAFLSTAIVFADEISRDTIGQFYGYSIDVFSVVDGNSRDYHSAVFGVLDVISTDSLAIIGGQYLPSPVLTLSARANVTGKAWFDETYITYLNGSVSYHGEDSLGAAEIYRASIVNLMNVVYDAVTLDLGNGGSENIFLNPAAINTRLSPNLAPPPYNPDFWVRNEISFFYGRLDPQYQTWAEMLQAGFPRNITLGNLTGLPDNSTMIANYLCPGYQLKPMSSFLANIFIGTSSMFLSAWAVWMFGIAIIAKMIKAPCVVCKCEGHLDGEGGASRRHDHNCHNEPPHPNPAAGSTAPTPVVGAESDNNSVITTEKKRVS